MLFWLALVSAVGGALCVGVAAVLEKYSADKQSRVSSLQFSLLWRLLADWPYLIGLGLDALSFILTLVAVHSLALFVVEPIIAFNVVLTALIEHFLLHRKLSQIAWAAIICTLIGLTLLALAATPETAHSVSQPLRWLMVFLPLAIAGVGSVVAKSHRHLATIGLGVLDGLAFGATAIVGRMLTFPHPFWQLIYNPLFWSLLGYGLIGILLLSIAFQRSNASVISASTTASETVVPIIIGIVLLGDSPKHKAWVLVVSGLLLTLIGILIIALPQTVPDQTESA